MTLKGGTSSACAACKYQRRRCVSDCPLAPYFPADQPKLFQNAHKLFGVRNILKILEQLDPSQQSEAMKSIKYQSNARDKNPIYGCVWEIQKLHMDIQMYYEELQVVHSQLACFRQQADNNNVAINDSMSQLQLGMAPPNNSLNMFQQDNASLHYSNNNISFIDAKDNNFVNPMWIQPSYNSCNEMNNNNNNNPTIIQSQMINYESLNNVQQQPCQDYDEIHPFFDTIDDRQSYIDSKEAYESSCESSLKDISQSIMEHVAENELKSAAACFSLTS